MTDWVLENPRVEDVPAAKHRWPPRWVLVMAAGAALAVHRSDALRGEVRSTTADNNGIPVSGPIGEGPRTPVPNPSWK
jgi:hypothetical protein